MANPNLKTDLKQNWKDAETVMPADTNQWAGGINNLNKIMPVYSSTGNFYTSTLNSDTYELQPLIFEDNSQNVSPSSYIDGMCVEFRVETKNPENCYVKVGGLAKKLIKTDDNVTLKAGKLLEGKFVKLRYLKSDDCFFLISSTPEGGGGFEIGDIGVSAFGVDESRGLRRYLNGGIIIADQFAEFAKKVDRAIALYPSLAKTEEEWQAISAISVGGQCGCFVVDKEAGTIRLPKIIMPIQGLADLSKLGEIVKAGLPDHTHTRGSMNITGSARVLGVGNPPTTSGIFTFTKDLTKENTNSGGQYWHEGRLSANASRSWTGSTSTPNYTEDISHGNTVQQEQIQYPYFIQVATGVEEAEPIINTLELNNPYSLLDIKWSDKKLNNISWKQSDGQPISQAVYPTVYSHILTEYNSAEDETEEIGGITITFRRGTDTGIKVTVDKDAYDQILSATGTAWYYVLDLQTQEFYLPQTNGFLQFGNNYGDYTPAGLPNIKGQVSNRMGDSNIVDGSFYTEEQSERNNEYTTPAGNNALLTKFDASLSSPIYKDDVTTVQPNSVNGYLYFYVGETVQNANLINAGRIEEKLVDKLDVNCTNATATTKEFISTQPIPDYDNPIAQGVTLENIVKTTYTATKNCFVAVRATASGASGGRCHAESLIYDMSDNIIVQGGTQLSTSANLTSSAGVFLAKGKSVQLQVAAQGHAIVTRQYSVFPLVGGV